MTNGEIVPGDGNPYGFTADKFEGYLWQMDGAVMVSFIISKQPGQGHFRELVERILASGHAIKVPTPFPNMERILSKNGFLKTTEFSAEYGEDVEVWVREPAVIAA